MDQRLQICRQNTQGNGLETWRLIHARYSIPLGTRSIGYLTRLLKPQLDEQKFEESFTTWEFQLSRYEQDNNTKLPDAVKIAMLLNETRGPLQQHLQLQAGNTTDQINGDRVLQSNSIIHQATGNRNRQQQPKAGTDGHRSNMVQQRQRLRELREQLQQQQLQRRKRQVQSTTGWTRKPIQTTTWIWQRKRIQQQSKRQRIIQQPSRRRRSKRKTSNKCLLQMWTTRTHGQAMQSGNLQL